MYTLRLCPRGSVLLYEKLFSGFIILELGSTLSLDPLVSHEASGTMSNWQERRQPPVEEFARKSLGQLVDVMAESHLTTEAEREENAYSRAPEGLTEGTISRTRKPVRGCCLAMPAWRTRRWRRRFRCCWRLCTASLDRAQSPVFEQLELC